MLFIAAILSLSESNAPLGARLKLRWGRDTVTFTESGKTHQLLIRQYFHAAHIAAVKLQSAKEAGGFIYLLLDVTGPSKDQPDNHQCGAGTEADLVWLKLDKDWKVTEGRNFPYESCWSTISSYDDPAWHGDTLSVIADYVREGGSTATKEASYNYKHPDEGLKITEAAEKKK